MLTDVVVLPVPPLWLKTARRAGAWMRRAARDRVASGPARRVGARRGLGAAAASAGVDAGCARDRAETHAAGLGEDLRAALVGARVAQLAADAHDLRDELDAKPLVARGARRAAGRLAADGLAVALLRAEEREAAVALFHLVAELDVEAPPAHAAALGHRGHRVRASCLIGSPMGQRSGSRTASATRLSAGSAARR